MYYFLIPIHQYYMKVCSSTVITMTLKVIDAGKVISNSISWYILYDILSVFRTNYNVFISIISTLLILTLSKA